MWLKLHSWMIESDGACFPPIQMYSFLNWTNNFRHPPPPLYAISCNYFELLNEMTLKVQEFDNKIVDFKHLHTVYQICAVTFLETYREFRCDTLLNVCLGASECFAFPVCLRKIHKDTESACHKGFILSISPRSYPGGTFNCLQVCSSSYQSNVTFAGW